MGCSLRVFVRARKTGGNSSYPPNIKAPWVDRAEQQGDLPGGDQPRQDAGDGNVCLRGRHTLDCMSVAHVVRQT